ncbi:MAG: hypothetical protein U1F20_01700 [Lysobacterales bacterium]
MRVDLELQHAARDVDGTGDVPGLEFGGFPDIDQHRIAPIGGEFRGRHFADLGARLGDEVGSGEGAGHGGTPKISVDTNIRYI